MALDLLLPPLCLACGAAVDRMGTLCADCWQRASFIEPPACACCGSPFEVDEGPGALCAPCLDAPPDYDRARAAMRYENVGRDLVLGFKLSDRTYAASALARWMVRSGGELLAESDLIAPVPLHRRRLFTRRYNQAALLAGEIGRQADRPVIWDVLERTRATKTQTRLSAAARTANVQGAFRVRPRRAEQVQGKRVILVDDVLTTGATADACARTLRDAGAAQIFVLTLARTVLGAT